MFPGVLCPVPKAPLLLSHKTYALEYDHINSQEIIATHSSRGKCFLVAVTFSVSFLVLPGYELNLQEIYVCIYFVLLKYSQLHGLFTGVNNKLDQPGIFILPFMKHFICFYSRADKIVEKPSQIGNN